MHVKVIKVRDADSDQRVLGWSLRCCWTEDYTFSNKILECARFGSTYTKIGTIQRRLAWPLRKDDTQIREAFHIFFKKRKKKRKKKDSGVHDILYLKLYNFE